MPYSLEKITKDLKNNQKDFINNCVDRYRNQISAVADTISADDEKQIIFIAGPSGSAKTSTSYLLENMLTERGTGVVRIKFDDFYLDRSRMPVLEDGTLDLESVYSLDLQLIKRCFSNLLNYRRTKVPHYDFHHGTRHDSPTEVQLEPGGIIIAEGIHALNPEIARKSLSKYSYKIFISPEEEFVSNGDPFVSSLDLRLTRRILRDYYGRGADPNKTLFLWKNVIESEKTRILPFKKNVNVTIDSTHAFEIFLYSKYITPIIKPYIACGKFEEKLQQMFDLYSSLQSIDKDDIPKDSVIQEFIRKIK